MGNQLANTVFLDYVIQRPRIYGWSLALSLLVCIFLAASIAVPAQHKEPFIWLMFCIPLLWLLWFFCVLFVHGERRFYKILLLWAFINFDIFLFIISFSDFDNWKYAKDGDIVIMTLYFPIAFPVLFLPDVLASSLSNAVDLLAKVFGNEGKAYVIAIWISLSVLSMVEAIGVSFIYSFFSSLRNNPRKAQ